MDAAWRKLTQQQAGRADSAIQFMRRARHIPGMSARYGPERLRVYHLALLVAREIDALLASLGCRGSLADQLTRCAESGVLNIAEGAAHRACRRKLYHYQIALASCGECIGGLDRLRDRYPNADIRIVRRHANMMSVMLAALIRTTEAREL